MLVFRTLLVLVLASTVAAAAQVPATRGAPLGASIGNGITVTGRATVAVVPDRARITVQMQGFVGTTGAGSIPLDEAAKALIDALHENGVGDAHEAVPIGNIGTRSAVPAIVGTVAKPTRERLETIARNVIEAIPAKYAAAFANAQIQTALVIDDCDAAETKAERAAFADARARAARIAGAAGVRLGNLVAINDGQTFLPPSCTTKPDNAEPNQGGFPFYVGYGPVVVPIVVTETVQFSIAGS